MSTRSFYMSEGAAFDQLQTVCSSLLEAVGSDLSHAYVDLFTDVPALPKLVQEALEDLRSLHERTPLRNSRKKKLPVRRRESTYMGLRLDLAVDKNRNLLSVFGPYSIHAEVYRRSDESPFFIMHDSGDSFHFRLADEEWGRVARHLAQAGIDLQTVQIA